MTSHSRGSFFNKDCIVHILKKIDFRSTLPSPTLYPENRHLEVFILIIPFKPSATTMKRNNASGWPCWSILCKLNLLVELPFTKMEIEHGHNIVLSIKFTCFQIPTFWAYTIRTPKILSPMHFHNTVWRSTNFYSSSSPHQQPYSPSLHYVGDSYFLGKHFVSC